MNNHQRMEQIGIKPKFPLIKSNDMSPQFYLNMSEQYTRLSNQYGIQRFEDKNRYIVETKIIPPEENVYGELFIAPYYKYDFNTMKPLIIYYMFMNGKQPDDINEKFISIFINIYEPEDDNLSPIGLSNNLIKSTKKFMTMKSEPDKYTNEEIHKILNKLLTRYRKIFKIIFDNPGFVDEWNSFYCGITRAKGITHTHIPTHAFGGDKSSKILETILLVMTLLIISLVISIVVSLIKRNIIFKRRNKNNNICRQSYDIK